MKKYLFLIIITFMFVIRVEAAEIDYMNQCGVCNGNGAMKSVSKDVKCDGNVFKVSKTAPPCINEEVSYSIPDPDFDSDCSDKKKKYKVLIMVDITSSMKQDDCTGCNAAAGAIKSIITGLRNKKNIEAQSKIVVFHYNKDDGDKVANYKGTTSFIDVNDINLDAAVTYFKDKKHYSGDTNTQYGLARAAQILKRDTKENEIPILFFITDGYPTMITTNTDVESILANPTANRHSLLYVTPARYYYYALKTMVSFKEYLNNDNAMLFNIGIMKNDELVRYFLNPTQSNYKNLSDNNNNGKELWTIFNDDLKGKEKHYDIVLRSSAGNSSYNDIPAKRVNKNTVEFFIKKASAPYINRDAGPYVYVPKKLEVTGVWINGYSVNFSSDRTSNCGDYHRFLISSSQYSDISSNSSMTIRVKLSGNIDKYAFNTSLIEKGFVSTLNSKKLVNGFAIGANAGELLTQIDDMMSSIPDDEVDCEPQMIDVSYKVYNYNGLCQHGNTATLEGKTLYYKFVYDNSKKSYYDSKGKKIESGTFVEIDTLKVGYLVYEDSEINFGNLINNSTYAGGSFGWVSEKGPKYENTISWKYSFVSKDKKPIVSPFMLRNVYKDSKGKNRYVGKFSSKKICEDESDSCKYVDISEICTKIKNGKCTSTLKESEVEATIKSSIDKKIREDSNNSVVSLFETVDSNDANNNSLVGIDFNRKVELDEYSNSYVYRSKFSLINSCIGKNSKVRYISESSCNSIDNELYGGNLRYVPLNYKDSVVDVELNSYNISNYNGLSIYVSGTCSVTVTQNSIRYRSVDETNPFPTGAADNWGGTSSSNRSIVESYKKRIGDFSNLYKSESYDYRYTGNFEYGNAPISDYNDWSNINASGSSKFLSALGDKILEQRASNKNYCPIGKFSDYCAGRLVK